MPRRKQAVSPLDPIQVLLERMKRMEDELRTIKQAKMSSVQTIREEQFLAPAQGMTAINWPYKQFCFYHDGEWICLPFPPTHAIKVFTDRTVNKVGDGVFRFPIEEDLNGTTLFKVAGFNGVAGTSTTTMQISKSPGAVRGIDLLSTPITIESSHYHSYSAGTQPVIKINEPEIKMATGDIIWINSDAVGAGSKGMGCYLTFVFKDKQA